MPFVLMDERQRNPNNEEYGLKGFATQTHFIVVLHHCSVFNNNNNNNNHLFYIALLKSPEVWGI